MVCHSLLQWTTSVRPLHHDPSVLGGPTRHGLVSWVSQGCDPVIRLASFLWLWLQSVCPLMPSHNTYRLTWFSLTLDMGYPLTAAPAKCSHCSLPWQGVSPPSCPSWPWTWSSSSWPSCACAAADPWTRGSSSQPPALAIINLKNKKDKEKKDTY